MPKKSKMPKKRITKSKPPSFRRAAAHHRHDSLSFRIELHVRQVSRKTLFRKFSRQTRTCCKPSSGLRPARLKRRVSCAYSCLFSHVVLCGPQVIEQRTSLIEQIEAAAKELESSGERGRWLASADPLVREISKDVNGPLLEMLADAIDFHDRDCIELFRTGCPLVSLLS